MRLARLGFFLLMYSYLVWHNSESWGIALDSLSFNLGIAVAALTGFTLFLIDNWWSLVTKPFEPQSVKMETKQTPIQITFAALLALLRVIIIAVAVLGIIYVGFIRSPP